MENKKFVKKKKKNTTASANKGFDGLLGAHVSALEDNSKAIEEMLKVLSSKKLTPSNLKELKFIKKELKRLDDNLDSLGDDDYGF